jgi:hypothetical protein|tara:strand:- start:2812 stop:3069 length:258 start_codon:yes stop_codon:yes gene_type:complete
MNTIAKMIGIKYPRPSVQGTRSDVVNLNNIEFIKSTIKEMLFIDNHDYILVNYNKQLFVCEKSSDSEYTRRIIIYHPLMNELNIE